MRAIWKMGRTQHFIGTVLTKNVGESVKIVNSLEMSFININLCYN